MSIAKKTYTHKIFTRGNAVLVTVLLSATAAAVKVNNWPATALFQKPAIATQSSQMSDRQILSDTQSHFVSTTQNIHTHASSLVELGDGKIRAFWFAGSREGASDVEILSSVYDPVKDAWSPEHSIINREKTQRSLLRYVKKIGNPVAQRATDGTLWLFYVTVSLGGWAGSSISAITSRDDGATWSPATRLITSPFINISTLIKGTPYLYSDGTMGLPAYHEFIGKFGELLRISNAGEVIDKQRISSGNSTLQPVMLIKNPQQALVLMRYSGTSPARVVATATDDAGWHWSTPAKTALPNPDAAITGAVMPDGKILAVLNDIETGRDALSMVVSADGGSSWKKIYQLEDQRKQPLDAAHYLQNTTALAKATESGITDAMLYAKSAQKNKCDAQNCSYEFSYPYLLQTHNGDFHLVYTWNRSYIKHIHFTRTWLEKRMVNIANAELY